MTAARPRGIVCSAAEVRGLLDNRVSLLVRPVKPQPVEYDGMWMWGRYETQRCAWGAVTNPQTPEQWCPWGQAGERRFVRETWAISAPVTSHSNVRFAYRADVYEGLKTWVSVLRPHHALIIAGEAVDMRWRSATQMPAWASRVSVDVTSVRIARLQELSEDDGKATGSQPFFERFTCIGRDQCLTSGEHAEDAPCRASFAVTWDEKYGHKMLWITNPWVWLLGVKRAEVA